KALQNIAVDELEEKKSFPRFATKGGTVQKREPQQGERMIDPATGMELVYVPKGCFQMGSNEYDDEKPVHEVCVDGFWMGKYEVTQGQWQKIMGDNPAGFKKGDKYPVEQVSWEDAQKFITQLKKRSGKEYRLPTEAEWEYAARAGASYKYSGGDDLDAVAWYGDNSGGSTHSVGQKKANAFGLYDMSGNVWEWCADWYGEKYYASSPKNNPTGPDSGTGRVLRGGGWFDRPVYCPSVYRNDRGPGNRRGNVGFRLVLPFQAAGS
ncbi:formylglycine-generating enzyme family protein, partial [Desulfobulbus sp. US1]|nr:formylglycine-generating enzyme family protein [Desulfobulbus sp. US1]